MATTRKRNSGFSSQPAEEASEEAKVEEFLDEVAAGMLETVSHKEEEERPVEPPRPVVIESIVPTEDPGPRFVETPPEPAPEPKATPAPKLVTPRRHPRNIPKFSRYK